MCPGYDQIHTSVRLGDYLLLKTSDTTVGVRVYSGQYPLPYGLRPTAHSRLATAVGSVDAKDVTRGMFVDAEEGP